MDSIETSNGQEPYVVVHVDKAKRQTERQMGDKKALIEWVVLNGS